MGKKDKGGSAPRKCDLCNGQGGTWVQDNGQKPSKMRWQPCPQCKGSGTK